MVLPICVLYGLRTSFRVVFSRIFQLPPHGASAATHPVECASFGVPHYDDPLYLQVEQERRREMNIAALVSGGVDSSVVVPLL